MPQKIYIVIWALLLTVSLSFDLTGGGILIASWCKFLIVVDCALLALTRKTDINLKLAMLFTVAADFCIVLTDWYELGVLFFCVTQNIYFYRHTKNAKLILLNFLYLVIFAVVFYITGSILISISAFYACCLLSSLLSSFLSSFKTRKSTILIPIGMTLFLLCDVCVFLYNMERVLPASVVTSQISSAAVILIWVFYAPSQLLLAKSDIL